MVDKDEPILRATDRRRIAASAGDRSGEERRREMGAGRATFFHWEVRSIAAR